jgi:prolyl-tRNA synthetase
MGCYGIGPARIAAAAIEQYADEKGISWPRALAPWDVHVVALGGEDELNAATALAEEIEATGLSVLLDDRPLRPGEKFADAELLGCPLRVTVGKRALESGNAEVQIRRGRVDHDGGVALRGGGAAVAELWRSVP